ncbi:hypothetical protein [Rhodoblastus sp.]|uniref:hypothetical protein n=1 Tax=Rhodoblastus sp. TaxID=1962975 RepID=UPI003F990D7A
MRRILSASLLPPLLALSACNANRPEPEVALPQAPVETVLRVSPHASEGGCAAEIDRYRGIVERDAKTGFVDQTVAAQIRSEIGEAQGACDAGDQLRARYLLHASQQRHGYPQG